MKRIWPLVLLGVVAYLVFALTTVPASLVTSRLASMGIVAGGVTGTAWNGRAQVLQAGALNLGAASWKLHPLTLLTGRVQADIELTRRDGFAKTELTMGLGGKTTFRQLTASVPMGAMPPQFFPGGWTGTLNLRLAELTLVKGWPASATGTIEAVDLTGPARKPSNIGSYKIAFPAPNQPAPAKSKSADASAGALVGALTDTGGPLKITGTLQLKPDRSYVIDGLVATGPQTPKDVADSLQYLGAPDPQGRRQFSLAGTF